MHGFKTLAAALAATTLFVGGLAFAADHAEAADQASPSAGMSQQEQATIGSDAQKMSKDAELAFADVNHARLSIFDGDIPTAKKLVEDASAAFDRAKTDRSIFMKAEADMQAPDQNHEAAKTPVAWLPVDGAVVMNEDFTADPAKKAAVKDANDKLAKGDRKGAMEKLKLAHVDVDFVMAAVPLKQTMADIDHAGELLQGGKYYETSQVLRKIEDSVHYANLDMGRGATSAHATNGAAAATH